MSRSADGLAAGNVLSATPWLWLATWVFQVTPVFFVGGFANMVSWQTMDHRGGGYVEYLAGRMARLLRPGLVFGAVWLVLPLVLGRLGLPGNESNMTPPTVCIIALTIWQVALTMLARGRVSAWLARRGLWTLVITVGSMAMTLYLWHLTAMVALYGLVLAAGGPLPAPGTGLWWATRPVWLALLATVYSAGALRT